MIIERIECNNSKTIRRKEGAWNIEANKFLGVIIFSTWVIICHVGGVMEDNVYRTRAG